MVDNLEIKDIKSCVSRVAKEYDIKKVDLFGSYATGKQTKKSDIDLLVDFNDPSMTLFKMFRFRRELEKQIGKKVDLVETPISKDSFLKIDKVVPIYG
jgi:predicted nucleotidyltransferase